MLKGRINTTRTIFILFSRLHRPEGTSHETRSISGSRKHKARRPATLQQKRNKNEEEKNRRSLRWDGISSAQTHCALILMWTEPHVAPVRSPWTGNGGKQQQRQPVCQCQTSLWQSVWSSHIFINSYLIWAYSLHRRTAGCDARLRATPACARVRRGGWRGDEGESCCSLPPAYTALLLIFQQQANVNILIWLWNLFRYLLLYIILSIFTFLLIAWSRLWWWRWWWW